MPPFQIQSAALDKAPATAASCCEEKWFCTCGWRQPVLARLTKKKEEKILSSWPCPMYLLCISLGWVFLPHYFSSKSEQFLLLGTLCSIHKVVWSHLVEIIKCSKNNGIGLLFLLYFSPILWHLSIDENSSIFRSLHSIFLNIRFGSRMLEQSFVISRWPPGTLLSEPVWGNISEISIIGAKTEEW